MSTHRRHPAERLPNGQAVRVPSVYDHPEYYDILFGWDRDHEAGTYAAALERHGVERGGAALEVAAGTAQIGIRLARLGFVVTALDRSEAMLTFAASAAKRRGVTITSLVADMTAFRAADRFDAAINPMSSFRLLLSDAAANAHLDCVTAALRPGGVYVLDMAFGTDGSAESDIDEWAMVRDGITVTATTHGVDVIDPAQGSALELAWHESLRPYTPGAFEQLVERHDNLAVEGCYRELDAEDGISKFSETLAEELPEVGRAIVVMTRR